jgi:hypothetical protein
MSPLQGSHAKSVGKDATEFEYEQIFDETSSQQEVYENTAKPMVEALFTQQHSLLFVYGVSNSGKTFTIQGPTDHSQPGIIPLALRDVFAMVDASADEHQVQISFSEFYSKKDIYDLLSSAGDEDTGKQTSRGSGSATKVPRSTTKRPLPAKSATSTSHGKSITAQMVAKSISFPDLSKVRVKSTDEALELFELGVTRKHVDATAVNKVSSRSHCVFTITLLHRIPSTDNEWEEGSTMNIIDLAGVERGKKAAFTCDANDAAAQKREKLRRDEASVINMTLSAVRFICRWWKMN